MSCRLLLAINTSRNIFEDLLTCFAPQCSSFVPQFHWEDCCLLLKLLSSTHRSCAVCCYILHTYCFNSNKWTFLLWEIQVCLPELVGCLCLFVTYVVLIFCEVRTSSLETGWWISSLNNMLLLELLSPWPYFKVMAACWKVKTESCIYSRSFWFDRDWTLCVSSALARSHVQILIFLLHWFKGDSYHVLGHSKSFNLGIFLCVISFLWNFVLWLPCYVLIIHLPSGTSISMNLT